MAFGSIAGRYVGRANAIFRHPVTQDIGAGNRRERPVRIESDKRQLLAAARAGCFVEQSLKPGLVRHRLKLGESWTEV